MVLAPVAVAGCHHLLDWLLLLLLLSAQSGSSGADLRITRVFWCVARRFEPRASLDLPRDFRTADLWLIHAADCRSRYSSWTCCGVRY